VIAFLAGHPTYEAIEAFTSASPGRTPVVHAVLTRHDQRQIDYISDGNARAARQPSTREVHVAPVSFAVDGGPDGVRDVIRSVRT